MRGLLGGSQGHVAYVTSTLPTFSQLVTLALNGLPAGVSATLDPQQMTAGARATITFNLSGANLSAGSYSFTVSGTGLIGGAPAVRTSSATLSVIAAGQTTLSGLVRSTEDDPVIGATVSLDGKTATTDAAGGFLLTGVTTGVTAGVDRPLMIDGRTANAPNRTYPTITEPATIVTGQANIVPYIFRLPIIDVANEVTVIPNQTTVVTTPKVPGLEVTIPAGANLRNRDGSPVTRVSVTPVPIDRTPAPLPSDVTVPLVFTIQPGGAMSDVPVPIAFPNLSGNDPGTRIELYAFDHDIVRWFRYGFGRVSQDGRTIQPEIDPATGRPYGISSFAWYGFNSPNSINDPSDIDCGNESENPVNLTTGVKIESALDVLFGGARGGLVLGRIYSSGRRAVAGRFGIGTRDTYDIRLAGSLPAGGTGRVLFPEQESGRLFEYVRTDADGGIVFATTATKSQLGDVVRHLPDGTYEYKPTGGGAMRFDASGKLVAAVDRNQNTTTLTYTGSNLTRITDAVGRLVSLEYDSSKRVIRATDPINRVIQYSYDSIGRLAQVTDPLGKSVLYAYDSLNFLDDDHG